MDFLFKIFKSEERFVGLCELKRKNKQRTSFYSGRPYSGHLRYFSTDVSKNVYLAT